MPTSHGLNCVFLGPLLGLNSLTCWSLYMLKHMAFLFVFFFFMKRYL